MSHSALKALLGPVHLRTQTRPNTPPGHCNGQPSVTLNHAQWGKDRPPGPLSTVGCLPDGCSAGRWDCASMPPPSDPQSTLARAAFGTKGQLPLRSNVSRGVEVLPRRTQDPGALPIVPTKPFPPLPMASERNNRVIALFDIDGTLTAARKVCVGVPEVPGAVPGPCVEACRCQVGVPLRPALCGSAPPTACTCRCSDHLNTLSTQTSLAAHGGVVFEAVLTTAVVCVCVCGVCWVCWVCVSSRSAWSRM